MKVFLINLAKNPDRLARSASRLAELGIEFERVEAVYGKDLSQEEKKRAVNRFRWWCAQGRKVRDGEIGCALSHYLIYRRMIEEHIPYACILEDDNAYRYSFSMVLSALEKKIDPLKAQVVLLTNFTDDRPAGSCVEMSRIYSDQCTAAYIITQCAASRILASNLPLHVPCDYWRRWVQRGLIELYHGFPTVVAQDGHPLFSYGIEVDDQLISDVEGDQESHFRNFSPIKKVLHRAKRFVGVFIDRIIPLEGQ